MEKSGIFSHLKKQNLSYMKSCRLCWADLRIFTWGFVYENLEKMPVTCFKAVTTKTRAAKMTFKLPYKYITKKEALGSKKFEEKIVGGNTIYKVGGQI